MRLYNTMTGQVEEFTPRGADVPVTIYACGITPYDVSHLGHALVGLTYDVLGRYLRYRGFQTRYVQNVTDIDDDILKRAARDGVAWDELGRTQTDRYLATMDRLNILRPDVYARATEETEKMVEIIGGLLEDGLAYNKEGHIFFRVKKDADYGKLSKYDRAEMLEIAAERGGKPNDPLKDDPLDFLLWQAAAPGEPTWPSPWGPGRPGWHIECSAMSMKYLGETIDVHGGGTDLIYPHHESEIAQSEGFSKKPFVRYWMHVGMLRYEGEKMSKSLGNLVMAPKLLETYSPDAIRLCLFSHRYREAWDYEDSAIEEGQALADRLKEAATAAVGDAPTGIDADGVRERFIAAMDDDYDTPTVLVILREFAEQIIAGSAKGESVQQAQATLRELTDVLGLTLV
ncbi:MAG TPA: cysteine--tRNA ligase [Thermomicrobiales bacterium]|jgi:L-cysteine:1D-myo-inositol 2-amino-2-deoxy-alpha-D-glucopyranoside ligase